MRCGCSIACAMAATRPTSSAARCATCWSAATPRISTSPPMPRRRKCKALFRNCRLIGRRFRLAHVVYGREIIEVATFRANVDDGSGDRELHEGGRLLRDNVYGTIEDDAVRRDFTANALYYAIEDFSVRDYTGGFDDVQNHVMKLIGDPEQRYREDPVRMLRAVRLAAKLGFHIDEASAAPLPVLAPLLRESAPARLFEECLKLFLSGHAVESFLGLERHGLLAVLLPESRGRIEIQPQRRLAQNAAGRPARHRRACRQRRTCIAGIPVRTAVVAGVLPRADGIAGAGHARRRSAASRRRSRHRAPADHAGAAATVLAADAGNLAAAVALRPAQSACRACSRIRVSAPRSISSCCAQFASAEHAEEIAFWREAQAQSGEELPSQFESANDLGRRGRRAAQAPSPSPQRHRRQRVSRTCRPGSDLAATSAMPPPPCTRRCRISTALPQTRLMRASKLYRTPAWGVAEQPDFINAAALLETRLPPRDLLDALLDIERSFGRERHGSERWGPRVLDLDLLLYDSAVIDEPGLRVPHPHLHERAFALLPLVEITTRCLHSRHRAGRRSIARAGFIRHRRRRLGRGSVRGQLRRRSRMYANTADRKPWTVPMLLDAKREGRKLVMLTAYDAGFAAGDRCRRRRPGAGRRFARHGRAGPRLAPCRSRSTTSSTTPPASRAA